MPRLAIAGAAEEKFQGDLEIGIGIDSGTVIAGNVGGGGRLDFTVIGDAVNTAARIETATRDDRRRGPVQRADSEPAAPGRAAHRAAHLGTDEGQAQPRRPVRARRERPAGREGGGARMILMLGLRELQWSRRRFAVAVLATALVFALGLLMSGVSASFDNEIDRTVDSFGADAWLVARGELRALHRSRDHPGVRGAGRPRAARRRPGRPRCRAEGDHDDAEPPERQPARRGAGRRRLAARLAGRLLARRGTAVADASLGVERRRRDRPERQALAGRRRDAAARPTSPASRR